ncbi:SDR family oxidoreductase [Nocardioides panacisoli]|uniref:SDR family NAD(P)-dependent oxidoreductase n=1 Tax=Nocardioides panacisoli TaxID=627624 RepID=UPI001C62D6DC|nr:SDR family oxidoreductase [Nocardioides panacisoli]QYJ03092.1 SDR family oxidoreductase [Nocardioides panacisoli]
MEPLQGKVAIVTGAGQGVGQGIALALADAGADIAIVGRTPEKLETTCGLLRERGVRTEGYVANLLDTDAIPELVDQIVTDFGRLDVVVNNAYDGVMMPLLDMSVKNFTKGFVAGPFAAFALMKSAHPHLVAAGGGSIVNLVTSAMVRWDPTNYGSYAASKSALRSLTRTAAVEWAGDRIRVNAIAPHAMSPGIRWWTENHPEEAEEFVASIPMRRIGDPESDIGRAVVSLVGPDFGYLTGATIPLDGGQAHF